MKENMRIYMSGSHSVGKSTLARFISKKYDLPIVTEVARSVLAEKELSLKDIRINIDSADLFQEEIFYRQIKEEQKYTSFISDRSIDCLAYSAQHTRILSTLINSPELKEYINKLKEKESLVFFVRPCKETLAQDGVREDLDWDGVMAIDSMIKLLLEMFDIPHFQINTPNMQERVRLIDSLLNKVKP